MSYEELLLLWRYTNNSECEKNTTTLTYPNLSPSKLKSKLNKSNRKLSITSSTFVYISIPILYKGGKWFLSRIPILLYTSSTTKHIMLNLHLYQAAYTVHHSQRSTILNHNTRFCIGSACFPPHSEFIVHYLFIIVCVN